MADNNTKYAEARSPHGNTNGQMTEMESTPNKNGVPAAAEEYKVFLFGNSVRDLILIPCLMILFFGVLTAFSALLLHGVVETQNSNAVLWSFFCVFITLVVLVVFVLSFPYNWTKIKRATDEAP
jgi:hypothetical protein